MPTESGANCQYASCSSRKFTFLIGGDLKYIIVFTDIILNLQTMTYLQPSAGTIINPLYCSEAAGILETDGVFSTKMTLFIVTKPSK